ncbi:ATP-binding protein [Streptomyces sp. NPDC057403]|uniref:ATP-binding protein n=1 Tax=Streptomyces sp. NPDC057403 TaxID=3346119 RepID=UPI003688ED19
MGADPAALRRQFAGELNRVLMGAEKRRGHALGRGELARRLNVSTSSLYAYLSGTTLPGIDVLDALLTALDVTGTEAGGLATLRDAAETARRLRSSGTSGPKARSVQDIPQQLPPAPADFVGRNAELARLDSWLDAVPVPRAGPVLIVVVEGTAGVGKTALALTWAHSIRDRFTDGHLHVNLRGFGPDEPMDPNEALHGFLLGLGVSPTAVPTHPPAASALLRTLLAARRVLLVLDNARSAEQVRPLLPGSPGSAAVVTSRNRLDGLVIREGARRLALDVLPRYDAHALLSRRIGSERLVRDRRATDELVDLCARLPLALSVAAARISAGPEDGFGHLVAELRGTQRRLDVLGNADTDLDLRSVFDQSYATLPASAARLFRRLGCHPGPDFDGPACAALLGVSNTPRVELDTLTTAHLVQQHAYGRYGLHDLLHAYARERGEGERNERVAATERLLQHYLRSARQADHQLEPWHPDRAASTTGTTEGFDGSSAAMAWFDGELAVLQALVAQAAAHDELSGYAWRLAESMAVYLRRSGRRHQRLAVHALARGAAERAGDAPAWSDAARRQADALARLHRFDEALDLLRKVLHTSRSTQNTEGVRAARLSLVRVYSALGDHARALPHARLALALARRNGDPVALADGLTSVAEQEQRLGQQAAALEHASQALELYTRVGHLDGQAAILLCLGQAEQALDRNPEAVERYEASVRLDRVLADRYREAHALDHLADAHAACGRGTRARLLREKALALLVELHHPDARLVRAKLSRTDEPAHTCAQETP